MVGPPVGEAATAVAGPAVGKAATTAVEAPGAAGAAPGREVALGPYLQQYDTYLLRYFACYEFLYDCKRFRIRVGGHQAWIRNMQLVNGS